MALAPFGVTGVGSWNWPHEPNLCTNVKSQAQCEANRNVQTKFKKLVPPVLTVAQAKLALAFFVTGSVRICQYQWQLTPLPQVRMIWACFRYPKLHVFVCHHDIFFMFFYSPESQCCSWRYADLKVVCVRGVKHFGVEHSLHGCLCLHSAGLWLSLFAFSPMRLLCKDLSGKKQIAKQ